MRNITINTKANAIEVTKVFATKANKYGTDEYNTLQKVRKDYPEFKVVTRKVSGKRNSFRGLTFEYIEKYISLHDKDGMIMNEYKNLRGESQEAIDAMAESLTYGEIKAWFLNTYPEIRAFHEAREKMVA